MSEPRQKPGASNQDYGTPKEFLAAVEAEFGPIVWDLAADSSNAVCPNYFNKEQDSLKQDWTLLPEGNLWLNPPFGNIKDFVEKASRESSPRRRVLMLVPASVGTNWFADHVYPRAFVMPIRPRLTFVGCKDPFPKDLMLCQFLGYSGHGFVPWKWK